MPKKKPKKVSQSKLIFEMMTEVTRAITQMRDNHITSIKQRNVELEAAHNDLNTKYQDLCRNYEQLLHQSKTFEFKAGEATAQLESLEAQNIKLSNEYLNLKRENADLRAKIELIVRIVKIHRFFVPVGKLRNLLLDNLNS